MPSQILYPSSLITNTSKSNSINQHLFSPLNKILENLPVTILNDLFLKKKTIGDFLFVFLLQLFISIINNIIIPQQADEGGDSNAGDKCQKISGTQHIKISRRLFQEGNLVNVVSKNLEKPSCTLCLILSLSLLKVFVKKPLHLRICA